MPAKAIWQFVHTEADALV